MADTDTEQLPNGTGALSEEDERLKQRPADIDADVREMERRKRVEALMSSKLFREELERVLDQQLHEGSDAPLLQRIREMVGGRLQSGSFRGPSCVLPINDIRGIEGVGYEKGEKILRCKLAAVYRLVDLFGWTQNGLPGQITARLNTAVEQVLTCPRGLLPHEVTASSLVKVDMQGQVQDQGTTNFPVNVEGFSVHASVHAARPDVRCVLHVRHGAALAVSATRGGLLPLCQEAALLGEIAYHSVPYGTLDNEERDKMVRALGPHAKILMLCSGGALCCGGTLEEAFHQAKLLIAACDVQLRLAAVPQDNLMFIDEETRRQMYEASRKPPADGGNKWRVGGEEFEALMRMLDNAGFRTGYIYRHPLVKNEVPKPKSDVEVPPAVSSLGYLLEEEELYRQGIWKKGTGKSGERTRWLNSPNVYQKVEVLETGTTDPRKITKWVDANNEEWVADGSPSHSSTPVKIDTLQFVPKNTNPKEFKALQQQIKENRRADKISAGPQSHILEGVSWDEASKLVGEDAANTHTGDHVVLMGAASKGIIQRGYQHNATVYSAPYARNPFDHVTDREIDEYKRTVERKQRSDYDTDLSESEAISGAQITSPASCTAPSETEEESRDEHRVLRIETKQAPVRSQPEVVLSDANEHQPRDPNLLSDDEVFLDSSVTSGTVTSSVVTSPAPEQVVIRTQHAEVHQTVNRGTIITPERSEALSTSKRSMHDYPRSPSFDDFVKIFDSPDKTIKSNKSESNFDTDKCKVKNFDVKLGAAKNMVDDMDKENVNLDRNVKNDDPKCKVCLHSRLELQKCNTSDTYGLACNSSRSSLLSIPSIDWDGKKSDYHLRTQSLTRQRSKSMKSYMYRTRSHSGFVNAMIKDPDPVHFHLPRCRSCGATSVSYSWEIPRDDRKTATPVSIYRSVDNIHQKCLDEESNVVKVAEKEVPVFKVQKECEFVESQEFTEDNYFGDLNQSFSSENNTIIEKKQDEEANVDETLKAEEQVKVQDEIFKAELVEVVISESSVSDNDNTCSTEGEYLSFTEDIEFDETNYVSPVKDLVQKDIRDYSIPIKFYCEDFVRKELSPVKSPLKILDNKSLGLEPILEESKSSYDDSGMSVCNMSENNKLEVIKETGASVIANIDERKLSESVWKNVHEISKEIFDTAKEIKVNLSDDAIVKLDKDESDAHGSFVSVNNETDLASEHDRKKITPIKVILDSKLGIDTEKEEHLSKDASEDFISIIDEVEIALELSPSSKKPEKYIIQSRIKSKQENDVYLIQDSAFDIAQVKEKSQDFNEYDKVDIPNEGLNKSHDEKTSDFVSLRNDKTADDFVPVNKEIDIKNEIIIQEPIENLEIAKIQEPVDNLPVVKNIMIDILTTVLAMLDLKTDKKYDNQQFLTTSVLERDSSCKDGGVYADDNEKQSVDDTSVNNQLTTPVETIMKVSSIRTDEVVDVNINTEKICEIVLSNDNANIAKDGPELRLSSYSAISSEPRSFDSTIEFEKYEIVADIVVDIINRIDDRKEKEISFKETKKCKQDFLCNVQGGSLTNVLLLSDDSSAGSKQFSPDFSDSETDSLVSLDTFSIAQMIDRIESVIAVTDDSVLTDTSELDITSHRVIEGILYHILDMVYFTIADVAKVADQKRRKKVVKIVDSKDNIYSSGSSHLSERETHIENVVDNKISAMEIKKDTNKKNEAEIVDINLVEPEKLETVEIETHTPESVLVQPEDKIIANYHETKVNEVFKAEIENMYKKEYGCNTCEQLITSSLTPDEIKSTTEESGDATVVAKTEEIKVTELIELSCPANFSSGFSAKIEQQVNFFQITKLEKESHKLTNVFEESVAKSDANHENTNKGIHSDIKIDVQKELNVESNKTEQDYDESSIGYESGDNKELSFDNTDKAVCENEPLEDETENTEPEDFLYESYLVHDPFPEEFTSADCSKLNNTPEDSFIEEKDYSFNFERGKIEFNDYNSTFEDESSYAVANHVIRDIVEKSFVDDDTNCFHCKELKAEELEKGGLGETFIINTDLTEVMNTAFVDSELFSRSSSPHDATFFQCDESPIKRNTNETSGPDLSILYEKEDTILNDPFVKQAPVISMSQTENSGGVKFWVSFDDSLDLEHKPTYRPIKKLENKMPSFVTFDLKDVSESSNDSTNVFNVYEKRNPKRASILVNEFKENELDSFVSCTSEFSCEASTANNNNLANNETKMSMLDLKFEITDKELAASKSDLSIVDFKMRLSDSEVKTLQSEHRLPQKRLIYDSRTRLQAKVQREYSSWPPYEETIFYRIISKFRLTESFDPNDFENIEFSDSF